MVKRAKSVAKNAVKDESVVKKTTVKNTKKVSSRSSRSTRQKNNDASSGFRLVPAVAMLLLLALFGISLFMLLRDKKYSADSVIVSDLNKLHAIFTEIDNDCKIIDFEHVKNYIDFLTVKEFVGSEVGAMNLSYPKNWKGPYVQDNPTVHEQQYIILRNKSGYYIVPGDGVKLANGKIVGQDIILNEKSDMETLLTTAEGLKSSEGALGVKIHAGGSYLKKVIQAPLRYL